MQDILNNGHFYSPTQGNLIFDQVIEALFQYMEDKSDKSYEIIVGCDSSSGEEPNFPLAIVILRMGEGGRFFLKSIKYPPAERKFFNWKSRILNEVMLSCELALSLREKVEERVKKSDGSLNFEFRYIHADVGENGATKDMIKEVTGLIIGNGFEPKIKPESFVASVIADRYA